MFILDVHVHVHVQSRGLTSSCGPYYIDSEQLLWLLELLIVLPSTTR